MSNENGSPRFSCRYCGDSGDVHRADGEWLGECDQCDAAEHLRAEKPPVEQVEAIKQNARELLDLIEANGVVMEPEFMAILRLLSINPVREDLQ
jgi:hypothetical protein